MTEAPLAGPLSPVTLAIGAAAATGIIVIGVVAGPGTVGCIQRGDFGACMSETFFGSGPTGVAESEPTQDVAALAEAPDESLAETESAAAPVPANEPAEDDTAAVEEAAAEPAVGADETATSVSQAVLPSFALVRVEPDGSAVIAGTASPSGEVRIFADDAQIGSETAEPSGDFAFVTDEPLPTGGVELRVFDVETDTYADTSVVVVVQDDRTSEPLVVASEPGEASEILQGLDSPEPAEPEAAEPAAVAEAEAPVETPAAAQEPEPMTVAEAEPEPAPAADASAEPDAPAAPASAPAPVAASPSGEAPTPAEPAAETPGTPAAQTAAVAAPEPVAGSVTPQVETPSPAEMASNEVAPEAPAPQAPAAPMATAEAEPRQEPAAEPQQPAVVKEPAGQPAQPSEPEAAPEPGEAVDVAASPEPAAPQEPAVAAAPEPVTVQPTIDAVEIDGDRNFFAGAGTDGMTVRLYVDNEPVGTTEVVDGRWLIETIGELDQQSQRVRIDMIAEDGTVVGRAEVDFVLELPDAVEEEIAIADNAAPESPEPAPAAPETPVASESPQTPAPAESEPAQAAEPAPAPEPSANAAPAPEPNPATEPTGDVPTMVGVTDGDRTTSGLAIIRRGDNLWTIARRVYGEGIRYTQIYEANTDQIRDPDLIYPGQVFDLPDTDQVVGRDEEQVEAAG